MRHDLHGQPCGRGELPDVHYLETGTDVPRVYNDANYLMFIRGFDAFK